MDGYLLLFVLILIAAAFWMMSGYNHLQSLSQRIGERRSNVENSLTTRSDLVTQLFENRQRERRSRGPDPHRRGTA